MLFAPQLRRYRLEQALTQEQLAERARVDRSTVSRAETGQPIRVSSLSKLARALKVKPLDLQKTDD